MCVYQLYTINRHYTKTKKNNGFVPVLKDTRKRYIQIDCGNCYQCRKKAYNNWRIRLLEEFKEDLSVKQFVTLSFSPEALNKLMHESGLEECNAIATLAMRRFLERWRKKYKKSVKHWFVTELGKNSSERLHMHGILWTDRSAKEVTDIWKYGNVDFGYKCDGSTITYISKYMLKTDIKHPGYKSIVLTSPGIGAVYINRTGKYTNAWRKEKTFLQYKEANGTNTGLPQYYKRKLFSESQRNFLWTVALNKNEAYLNGRTYELNKWWEEKLYRRAIKEERERSERLGYPGLKELKQRSRYNITARMLANFKDIGKTKAEAPMLYSEIEKLQRKYQRSKLFELEAQSFDRRRTREWDDYEKFIASGEITIIVSEKYEEKSREIMRN